MSDDYPPGFSPDQIEPAPEVPTSVAALQRRLEEVERERDMWKREAAQWHESMAGGNEELAAERAAHAEARREQDIAARGRLDAEIRAERAEAALRPLEWTGKGAHGEAVCILCRGFKWNGHVAGCWFSASPQPTPAKEPTR